MKVNINLLIKNFSRKLICSYYFPKASSISLNSSAHSLKVISFPLRYNLLILDNVVSKPSLSSLDGNVGCLDFMKSEYLIFFLSDDVT